MSKKLLSLIICSSFILVSIARADDEDKYIENPELLAKIIIEGSKQRFFATGVAALKDNLDSLAVRPNSWLDPVKFKISNKNGNSFKFDALQSGTAVEAPICQYFEIHFSGEYVKNIPTINGYWAINHVDVIFTNRAQCL